MSRPDFSASPLLVIDPGHPLAVLSRRLPRASLEAAVAPKLARDARPAKQLSGEDLAGRFEGEFGGGISPAGRLRMPVRLMFSLHCLKNSFNLSDEELVERWAKNVQWKFVSGMDYDEPRLPRHPTQIGRFRHGSTSRAGSRSTSPRLKSPTSTVRWASAAASASTAMAATAVSR